MVIIVDGMKKRSHRYRPVVIIVVVALCVVLDIMCVLLGVVIDIITHLLYGAGE